MLSSAATRMLDSRRHSGGSTSLLSTLQLPVGKLRASRPLTSNGSQPAGLAVEGCHGDQRAFV